MAELWTSIAFFTLFHLLPSTRLRGMAIASLGRTAFMLAYSAISLVLFLWLFAAFWRAEYDGAFFVTSPLVRASSAAVMLLAFWFFVGAVWKKPRIVLTAEEALRARDGIRGMVRITRHPFLWSLVLWSLVHVLNNADPAGMSLFGYFFLLALLGTWPIDRRRARLIKAKRWQEIRRETSSIPFVAIVQGRQKLSTALAEMGWAVPLAALVFWALVLMFHESLFGLPVFY